MLKYIWTTIKKYLRDERGFAILPAIGAGVSAASALGGLFGKRKKPAPVNVTPLMTTIQQGAQRQREALAGLRPGLQPFTQNYQTGINQALNTAGESGRASSAQYLQDIGKTFSPEADARLANTLSQRVLEQQPALAQQQREQLAATGGLQRGAASRASTQLSNQLAQDLSRGQTDLALQQEQQRQGALREATTKAFDLDQNFIQQKLGINKDTLATVFNTGREDLIREALGLLGIDANTTQQQLDLQKFGLNQDLARSTAGAQGRNELLNTLLQGGLQGLSTYFTQKG